MRNSIIYACFALAYTACTTGSPELNILKKDTIAHDTATVETKQELYSSIPDFTDTHITYKTDSSETNNFVEKRITDALQKISSEDEPWVNLPDFTNCTHAIIGKIHTNNFYIIITRSKSNTTSDHVISGIITNENGDISNQMVLAAYSSGSGASTEVFSDISSIKNNQITITKIENSWDSQSSFTKTDTTLFVAKLSHNADKITVSWQ